MQRIYWTAYCNKDRHQAIFDLEAIIYNHGFITDFNRFSDVSISLIIEIEERKIKPLYSDLQAYFHINETYTIDSISEVECVILVNITFTKATGDLIIEIPAIPG